MKDEKKRKQEITVELAAAAQTAYIEDKKREQQAQQGKPANLGLESGWGGKGR